VARTSLQALGDDSIIDGKVLASMFDPRKFMCKITPLHRTNSCEANHIQTSGGYDSFVPYKKVEEDLKANGFDVIVFVPSYDEDNGLITCGNAILSGKKPTSSYKEVVF
jgi:23S rRNA (adenine2503-C2)-methyltransferase